MSAPWLTLGLHDIARLILILYCLASIFKSKLFILLCYHFLLTKRLSIRNIKLILYYTRFTLHSSNEDIAPNKKKTLLRSEITYTKNSHEPGYII